MGFDVSRAFLTGPDYFRRYRVADAGVPLGEANLAPEAELLVIVRGDARRAFLLRQIAYHHVAQGELAGQPYVVTF